MRSRKFHDYGSRPGECHGMRDLKAINPMDAAQTHTHRSAWPIVGAKPDRTRTPPKPDHLLAAGPVHGSICLKPGPDQGGFAAVHAKSAEEALVGPRGNAIVYISYDRIAAFVDGIAEDLAGRGYAAAVGVLRGGAFPAVLASHAAGMPVTFLRYDRPRRQVFWDTPADVRPPSGSRILLCEDFAGSGYTLADCKAFLMGQGHSVDVLAVAYDDLSRERPDFGIDMRGRHAVFPWERHFLSRAWGGPASSAVPPKPDHEYQSWGYDLDGVFLHDVPIEIYRADMEAALAFRDTLRPVEVPFAVPTDAVIITARPRCDEERTRTWLECAGYGHLRLEMRADATPGVLPSAAHKAEACVRLGITHFVESDPAQAIEIATLVPWIRVLNWNAADQRGRWVTAEPATVALWDMRHSVE
jgi:hypoxanthine phosphoribosyltransferase